MDRLVVLIPDERNVATALLQKLRPHSTFTVDDYSLAVYIVDGSKVTFNNINEAEPDEPLCIYGVKLHILNQSDSFDLKNRRPHYHPRKEVRELVGAAG